MMTTRPIADDRLFHNTSALQAVSACRPAAATVPVAGKRISAGRYCCQPDGVEPGLTDLTAREISAAEHTLPCARRPAAAAFLSADLDDE